MRILGIHHVTLAVRDVDEARETFAALFAIASGEARAVPAFGVRNTELRFGDDVIELAAPVDADNPLRRFLERKGEGFYNLALEVDDIRAAVRELAAKGVRVSEPVESEPGVQSAFVTMAATHGLSIQLVEIAAVQRDATQPELGAPRIDVATPAAEATIVDAHADHLPEEDAPDFRPPPSAAPLDLTPDEWSDVD